jgi:hypothetical protein
MSTRSFPEQTTPTHSERASLMMKKVVLLRGGERERENERAFVVICAGQ